MLRDNQTLPSRDDKQTFENESERKTNGIYVNNAKLHCDGSTQFLIEIFQLENVHRK